MSDSPAAASSVEPSDPGAAPDGAEAASCCSGLPPRVARWCSMLLDLSRRNRLLNFKDGPGAVRLSFDAPEFLEDAIAENTAYKILETPEKGPRIAALFPADAPRSAAARGGWGRLRTEAAGTVPAQEPEQTRAQEPAPSERGLPSEARVGEYSVRDGAAERGAGTA